MITTITITIKVGIHSRITVTCSMDALVMAEFLARHLVEHKPMQNP